MNNICQAVLYMVMFNKSVPESKPSELVAEGAWQIQMRQLAFGIEKDIIKLFKGKIKQSNTYILSKSNEKNYCRR